MLKVRSGDKVAQALVIELVTLLTGADAFFHPALQLEIRGADFNFSSRKKLKADEELVRLPLRCMPVLDDFNWSLDGSQNLCWTPVDMPFAADYALHKQLVDLLVQLYNRFGKLAAYARHSPVIQLADKRPLVECLLALTHDGPFRSKLDQGLDQLMIHAFWHNRIFSDYLTGRMHLIPVMEFFDHSVFADNFFWDDLEGGQRALHHAFQPTGGSKGLFARYEIMDNLHAFVKYGFVDDKAFFVQSQPFSLPLCDTVSLEIGCLSASSNQCHVKDWQSQPKFSNSLMYRASLKLLPDRVIMPYMLIPPARHMPAFDDALEAQLREIERHAGMPRGGLANPGVMREVKMALLTENEAAYRSLSREARGAQLESNAPATRLLKKMLTHQRRILKEFKMALG